MGSYIKDLGGHCVLFVMYYKWGTLEVYVTVKTNKKYCWDLEEQREMLNMVVLANPGCICVKQYRHCVLLNVK